VFEPPAKEGSWTAPAGDDCGSDGVAAFELRPRIAPQPVVVAVDSKVLAAASVAEPFAAQPVPTFQPLSRILTY
jgi:hypothetical protein